MQKTLYIIVGFIAGIVLNLLFHAVFAAPVCNADPAFNRVECCNHPDKSGKCPIGAAVELYNL